MTDAITGASSPWTAAAGAGSTTASSTTAGSTTAGTGVNAMGSDAFLKLLVAQLKYQDPSHPTDGTQMLGQTAQFQMVEKLQLLTDQNTQLLGQQQTLASVGLVGRTVAFSSGGHGAEGVVSSVRFTPGGPQLTIGTSEVPLSAVTEVHTAG
jgi:flagellar basal-body rod modification protein FlgD